MATVDLRQQGWDSAAKDSADGIIKIINAKAAADKSQTDLQKELLLDKINRQRNRQDKQQEQQDQINNWGKMFDPAAGSQTPAPQGNPITNNSGIANSATPNTIGDNPNSPVSPIGGAMPVGGYTAQNPPPMSMADGSNQAQIQQEMAAQQQQSQAPVQAQPQPMQSQLAQSQPQVSSQYTDLGFTPIGLGQLGIARKGKPEPKDYAYIQALNKIKQGNASDGEIELVKDFNGVKGDTSPLQGIDTINLSPDQIGEALKAKNPGHYNFLESVKNGQYKISGRSSKEMNKVVEQIQTIWPGTDLQALQARYDVRKDFTSGKTSNNITALNTALSHLDKLSTNADQLDNGSFRFGNKLGNILKTETGDSRVRVLKSDIHAVTGELSSTFKQSGATDAEIKNFESTLDSADSKEVVKDVVNEFIGLIGGRTQPLLEKYQNAFGQDATFPVVGKAGQSVLQKHGYSWNPQTGEVVQENKNTAQQNTSNRPTAVNPKTGQRLQLSEDGKSWEPM